MNIKLLGDGVLERALFNAICEKHPNFSAVLEKYGITVQGADTSIDVKLLINGQEFPVGALGNILKREYDRIDALACERADMIISQLGSDIEDKLRGIREVASIALRDFARKNNVDWLAED
jgi:hypothetical protein